VRDAGDCFDTVEECFVVNDCKCQSQRNRPLQRVLLVHERFPPDYAGGGEYVVLKTAESLQAMGLDVKVLTTGNVCNEVSDAFDVRRIPVSPYSFNFFSKRIAKEANDSDLIHAFTYHSMFPAYRAAQSSKKPLIFGMLAYFDNAWIDMKGPLVGGIFRRIEKSLLKLPVDGRVFLSDMSMGQARQAGLSLPGDRVIEPGISLQDYYAGADKDCVVYAGKLDARKGIDQIIQVASRLSNVPFRVSGWGKDTEKYASLLPENVRLVPFEGRQTVVKELARARIFIFPTKAETFGLAVAEAMASGCAVVSTSTLPFHGKKIVAGDLESLTTAIEQLWNDPMACAAMGRRNQNLARRYNWNRHVEQLVCMYETALSNHQLTERFWKFHAEVDTKLFWSQVIMTRRRLTRS